MSQSYDFIRTLRCYNTVALVADTENNMYDANTGQNAVIPSGALVELVYLHANSALTSGITLKVGIQGSNEYLVPEASAVTTTNVNSSNVQYRLSGKFQTVSSDQQLVVVPVGTGVSGQLEVYIVYKFYTDLP